jgi:hypothetical protein
VAASDPIIRASEIGQYTFCARAWWLGRIKGYRPTNLESLQQGTAYHISHGRAVKGAYALRRLAIALLILAVAALMAWIFLSLGF